MVEDRRRNEDGGERFRTERPDSPQGCRDEASADAQNCCSGDDGAGSRMGRMFAMMRECCPAGHDVSGDADRMRTMMQECCDGGDAPGCCEMFHDARGKGKEGQDGSE